MPTTPSESEQIDIIKYVEETFSVYESLSDDYRSRMTDVYEAYSTFKKNKNNKWDTTFKVNKAHEVVEKILPRIIAKNPRWLVNLRTDQFNPGDKLLPPEAKLAQLQERQEMSRAVQDFLVTTFDQYELPELLRVWAKQMVTYGNGVAKVKFKYQTAVLPADETTGKKSKKKVTGEYATIDVRSWTDIYVDPRYRSMEDMPAVIEIKEGVRLADLKRDPKLFNIDKLEDMPPMTAFSEDNDQYISTIRAISGIPSQEVSAPVDTNSLALKYFYGKYTPEGEEEERHYKITTVEGMMLIGFEEIIQNPFVDIKCFDDPEVWYAYGFVERIIGLQEELNFKKNSASEYINKSLNREYIWSPNSGVDPADLQSRPGNIIATNKDAQTALANLIELPNREINSSYFQEQNDIERQIQSMTFTVDTAQPQSQQGLTNTATGIRVKFFESNSVIDEIRRHFERGMEQLAIKLLQETFANIDGNIHIKKIGDKGYWDINKEALRDALTRYSIKVEANSSAFDDLENRRSDAVAFFNASLQALHAGVPVNITEAYKDVVATFEKRDVEKFLQQQPTQQVGGTAQIAEPETTPSDAAEITEAVAKGGVTEGL